MKQPSVPRSHMTLLLLALALSMLAACSNEPTTPSPTAVALTPPPATMAATIAPILSVPTGVPTEPLMSQPGTPIDVNATDAALPTDLPATTVQPPPATVVSEATPALPQPSALASAGDAAQTPDLVGLVERIDGQTLVIKQMRGSARGSSVTVQLSADTTLQMAVDMQPSDIQVGDPLTATGTKHGEVLEARQVVIGQVGGMLGRASAGGEQGHMGESIFGTVEQITGDTIRVKTQDGSGLTVQLTADTRVLKMTDIQASEIQAGTLAMVFGSRNGEVLRATRVELVPRPQR